jgi:hypothetical protein
LQLPSKFVLKRIYTLGKLRERKKKNEEEGMVLKLESAKKP